MSDRGELWCRCGDEHITNRVDGLCLIVECRLCGCSAVTTNPDSMLYDTQEYAVFVETDLPAKQAAVRTAVALGRTSREVLDAIGSRKALASGVSAHEVVRAAAILAERGIGVQVKPAFRWPLPRPVSAN